MDFKKVKIVACAPKPNYHVWVLFDDGLEGAETLAWGEEIDLDPYVLREKLVK